jgi:hypothetical protein
MNDCNPTNASKTVVGRLMSECSDDQPVIRMVRRYECGRSTGFVYEFDGRRCARLAPGGCWLRLVDALGAFDITPKELMASSVTPDDEDIAEALAEAFTAAGEPATIRQSQDGRWWVNMSYVGSVMVDEGEVQLRHRRRKYWAQGIIDAVLGEMGVE